MSENDSRTVCWPFHPNPQPPPVPRITLPLSLSRDDLTETTQTRALWPEQVCLQCWGSQEVRTVEGGVRRWEADGGRHSFGGREKPSLMTRLQLSWNNRDIMTLWTHKNTPSRSPTGTVTPSPPQHQQGTETCILSLFLNGVIPMRARFENLKLMSQVTQLNTKNWANTATADILCFSCLSTRWTVIIFPFRHESLSGGTCANCSFFFATLEIVLR